MTNVVSLTDWSAPTPDKCLIDELRAMLAMAEAGTLTGLFYAAEFANAEPELFAYPIYDQFRVYGLLDELKLHVRNQSDDE